eukprot:2350010-Amphidinium_carterae.1
MRTCEVKKLLMVYWEIVDKCKDAYKWGMEQHLLEWCGENVRSLLAVVQQENGELKEEMILVCNALRNDLMHPNECLGCALSCAMCPM